MYEAGTTSSLNPILFSLQATRQYLNNFTTQWVDKTPRSGQKLSKTMLKKADGVVTPSGGALLSAISLTSSQPSSGVSPEVVTSTVTTDSKPDPTSITAVYLLTTMVQSVTTPFRSTHPKTTDR